MGKEVYPCRYWIDPWRLDGKCQDIDKSTRIEVKISIPGTSAIPDEWLCQIILFLQTSWILKKGYY